jgi:hypothetical protein
MEIQIKTTEWISFQTINDMSRIAGYMKVLGATAEDIGRVLGISRRTYFEWCKAGLDKAVIERAIGFSYRLLDDLNHKDSLSKEDLKLKKDIEFRLKKFLDEADSFDRDMMAEFEKFKSMRFENGK